MSAKLQRFNLRTAFDLETEGEWCLYASHLAAVNHLERRIAALEKENSDLRSALTEANYPRYSPFEKPCFCEVNEVSPTCPIHGVPQSNPEAK